MYIGNLPDQLTPSLVSINTLPKPLRCPFRFTTSQLLENTTCEAEPWASEHFIVDVEVSAVASLLRSYVSLVLR